MLTRTARKPRGEIIKHVKSIHVSRAHKNEVQGGRRTYNVVGDWQGSYMARGAADFAPCRLSARELPGRGGRATCDPIRVWREEFARRSLNVDFEPLSDAPFRAGIAPILERIVR